MDLANYNVPKSTSTSTKSNLPVDIDVDRVTGYLRVKVKDPYLGRAFVEKALAVLPESELYSIAEFALREGNHPGRLFVSVCNKAIKEKSR